MIENEERPMLKEVEELLSKTKNCELTRSESSAYNYLIDYVELGFESSHEADCLLDLCMEVLQEKVNNEMTHVKP